MKRLTIAAILIVVFTTVALSQVTQRNLLSKKYSADAVKSTLIKRDLWKPYPRSAAEWRAAISADRAAELIKNGEKYLNSEPPAISATLTLEYVRTGDRERYQERSFARRNRLFALVLAETVEDKGRFTDTIANYVWTICEETYWGVPAHLGVQKAKNGLPDAADPTVDLFGAETAATLALTDYFVGQKLDKVSPLIRKRIYREAVTKIFGPMDEPGRYSWLDPTKQVNNWNPWIVSNVMVASLLLEPDENKRADRLYRQMKWLDIYLNGLGDDGGCDEGPSYWFAAGGSVFDTLEILDSATDKKIAIYDEPLIGRMASYIYKMHIAERYFVNFADADPKFWPDGLMLYRFGKAIKDEKMVEFGEYLYTLSKGRAGEGFMKPRQINDLLTAGSIPHRESYEPVSDAWFPDIQVMTARTKAGLFLATHAGHNAESHNHNDVGDFIVYSGNEPVIIDAGRGNYTAKTFSSKRYELWFTQSQYHNLPIINGIGQSAGRAFAGTDVIHSANAAESSLSMNIANAYPKDAGLKRWYRRVSLDRSAGNVSVSDRFELSAPGKIDQVFMSICDVDISVPGKIVLTTAGGRKFELQYDTAMKAVIDLPSTDGPEYSSFKTKWDSRPVKRIILSSVTPKTAGEFRYVIAPQ